MCSNSVHWFQVQDNDNVLTAANSSIPKKPLTWVSCLMLIIMIMLMLQNAITCFYGKKIWLVLEIRKECLIGQFYAYIFWVFACYRHWVIQHWLFSMYLAQKLDQLIFMLYQHLTVAKCPSIHYPSFLPFTHQSIHDFIHPSPSINSSFPKLKVSIYLYILTSFHALTHAFFFHPSIYPVFTVILIMNNILLQIYCGKYIIFFQRTPLFLKNTFITAISRKYS